MFHLDYCIRLNKLGEESLANMNNFFCFHKQLEIFQDRFPNFPSCFFLGPFILLTQSFSLKCQNWRKLLTRMVTGLRKKLETKLENLSWNVRTWTVLEVSVTIRQWHKAGFCQKGILGALCLIITVRWPVISVWKLVLEENPLSHFTLLEGLIWITS